MKQGRQAVVLGIVVAVFGGVAYAGSLIGPSQIADNAIRARHIAAGAVQTSELKDRSITTRKMKSLRVLGHSGRRTFDVDTGSASDVKTYVAFKSKTGQIEFRFGCTWSNTSGLVRGFAAIVAQPSGSLLTISSGAGLQKNHTTVTGDTAAVGVAGAPGVLSQEAGTFSAITPSGDTLQGMYQLVVNRDNATGEDCTFIASAIA